jgi:hypothetical protein
LAPGALGWERLFASGQADTKGRFEGAKVAIL